MKCIAIDDEPIALSILRQYCQRNGDLELETYSDPVVGMRAVERVKPDLLFLDIQMGEIRGIELARDPERNFPRFYDGICPICC